MKTWRTWKTIADKKTGASYLISIVWVEYFRIHSKIEWISNTWTEFFVFIHYKNAIAYTESWGSLRSQATAGLRLMLSQTPPQT